MKKLYAIIGLIVALATSSVNAQESTDSVPTNSIPTNSAPILDTPIWQFLTQGSNWVVAPYFIINVTDGDVGVGIGAGYKLSDYVVPTIRLDYLKGHVIVPSGTLQLQVPVILFGKVRATPFVYTGVATSISGNSEQGDVIVINGIGLIVSLPPNDKFYVPDYVLGDYEHWNGGGFNDNQIRIGVGFKF